MTSRAICFLRVSCPSGCGPASADKRHSGQNNRRKIHVPVELAILWVPVTSGIGHESSPNRSTAKFELPRRSPYKDPEASVVIFVQHSSLALIARWPIRSGDNIIDEWIIDADIAAVALDAS